MSTCRVPTSKTIIIIHPQVETLKFGKSSIVLQAIPKFKSKQQKKQTDESEINKLKSEYLRF